MVSQGNDVAGVPLPLREIEMPSMPVNPDVFDVFSVETALRLEVAPLDLEDERLLVAVVPPLTVAREDQIWRASRLPVEIVVASRDEILAYLKRGDGTGRVLRQVTEDFAPKLVREVLTGEDDVVDLDAVVGEAGIVRLLNSIFMSALEKQASDIHFERAQDGLQVKYRIDGILMHATDQIDVSYQEELVSRIKVLAELDIAESRVPQDGRFRLRFEDREIDFRVSILPTQNGEDVVIRILDKATLVKDGSNLSLDGLGFYANDLQVIRAAIRQPHGLVLLTGPTGSGKTTTLYGALGEISRGDEKIITIEDPIEYRIPNISQIPINEKKKLTFAKGLRSILRHDPDKIMIGEIRDEETAAIAIQAALTGHLVLASVHANNTVDVVSRFAHWGIDLNDFATALNIVFAQRLFRQVCAECSENTEPGCTHCSNSGYSGRVAALEYLKVDEEMSEMIAKRQIFAAMTSAEARGIAKPLASAANALVENGVTRQDEVNRVLGQE